MNNTNTITLVDSCTNSLCPKHIFILLVHIHPQVAKRLQQHELFASVVIAGHACISQMSVIDNNLTSLVSPTQSTGGGILTIISHTMKIHCKNATVVLAACQCVDSLARLPLGRDRLGKYSLLLICFFDDAIGRARIVTIVFINPFHTHLIIP